MRVPKYNSSGIESTVGINAKVNTGAPIEAFGGGSSMLGATQAAQGLIKSGQDIMLEQKKQADDAVSMKVYDRLLQTKNNLLYSETGAMTKKGQAALGAAEHYSGEFEKVATDLEASLANDDQRAMYAKIKSRVSLDLNDTIQRHTYGESEKLKREVAISTMKSITDDAILNWHQPGKVDEAVTFAKDLARKVAKDEGLIDPEGKVDLVEERAKEAGSKVYAGIIDRMVATGADLKAKEYYESVKGEITAEDARPLLRSMEIGSTRAESQRLTDQYVSKYSDMGRAMKAAMAEVPYGELRDQVKTRIRDHFQELEAMDTQRERNNFDRASMILEKSGGKSKPTPQLLSGLSLDKRKELDRLEAYFKGGGRDPEEGSDAYYDLLRIQAKAPDKFKDLHLSEWRGKITSGELKSFMNAQQGDTSKVTKELDDYRSVESIVGATIKTMGIAKDPDEVKAFTSEVARQQRIETRKKGRPLDNEEIQRITDNLAIPVLEADTGISFLGDRYFQKTNRLYKTDPNLTVEIDFKSIPPLELEKIKRSFRDNKVPYTDEDALSAYIEKIRKLRAR